MVAGTYTGRVRTVVWRHAREIPFTGRVGTVGSFKYVRNFGVIGEVRYFTERENVKRSRNRQTYDK